MAIKKLDAIALEKEESNITKDSITVEEAEYLLDKGMGELAVLATVVESTANCFNNSAFNDLLNTDEFSQFRESMFFYISEVIPRLLKGDIDSIIDNADPDNYDSKEEFEKGLEELRIKFFNNLIQKYLNN